MTQVGNDLGDLEDQVPCVGIGDFPSLTVEAGPDGQVVGIGHIFFESQIGPARSESIQALGDSRALSRVASLGKSRAVMSLTMV